MKLLKPLLLIALALVAALAGWLTWTVWQTLPQRDGTLALRGLQGEVLVRYDERGVPHIRAGGEADLYRALGYVHAQDRLFQMEMARRLAQGELAEILGPNLINTDKLFRTLGIRQHAEEAAARLNPQSPATQALLAYLDGINQYQARRQPLEFKLLGITPRPFRPQDTLAVTGYLAYSFAAAFRTEPVMTYVRDKLGADYLRIFEEQPGASPGAPVALDSSTWKSLAQVAQASLDAAEQGRLPLLEGSNAWVIAGSRTASGKPLLAGDPHISFALPSVWYEAHLSAPGFELYGHHQALSPFALLGHNQDFGWSLTMFQNDDVDFVAEKRHPKDAGKVWHQGRWVEVISRTETIAVKGAAPVALTLRRSPHGPWITDAFADTLGEQPVALWWAFLETENPLMDAFYQLNRASSLGRARDAARLIHAPGLNVVWAHRSGDIAWWAAARIPERPRGVNSSFILDAEKAEAGKPGFLPFERNPQAENPASGYIVSANQAPRQRAPAGYYNPPERAQRLDAALQAPGKRWDTASSQALQLDGGTAFGPSLLKHLQPLLEAHASSREQKLLEQLAAWNGEHSLESTSATVFNHFLYELSRAALADELPAPLFESLLKTRAIEPALLRLAADADSPWWNDKTTKPREDRTQVARRAWANTLDHLEALYGKDSSTWTWGRAHTVTHGHPLGRKAPLHLLLDAGPYPVPGGREVPNNFAHPLGPAPWKVNYGPSTRRVIDFAQPGQAVGINPVGQSGAPFDRHYMDQAPLYHRGGYAAQHLLEDDVLRHTRSTLRLAPAP